MRLASRFGALCIGVLVCASCGDDSPTSPSGGNISGTWTGDFISAGRRQPATVTLTQAGSSVTGNWVKYEGPNNADGQGTVTGQVSGNTFSGSITNTTVCQPATATVNGTISGNTMTWNSGGFNNSRSCSVVAFALDLRK